MRAEASGTHSFHFGLNPSKVNSSSTLGWVAGSLRGIEVACWYTWPGMLDALKRTPVVGATEVEVATAETGAATVVGGGAAACVAVTGAARGLSATDSSAASPWKRTPSDKGVSAGTEASVEPGVAAAAPGIVTTAG